MLPNYWISIKQKQVKRKKLKFNTKFPKERWQIEWSAVRQGLSTLNKWKKTKTTRKLQQKKLNEVKKIYESAKVKIINIKS